MFVILLVGFIVMAAALYTEVKYRPPMWLHMTLWLPLVIVLSLGLLRPMKGLLVALQFSNKAQQGRLQSEPDAMATELPASNVPRVVNGRPTGQDQID